MIYLNKLNSRNVVYSDSHCTCGHYVKINDLSGYCPFIGCIEGHNHLKYVKPVKSENSKAIQCFKDLIEKLEEASRTTDIP